MAEKMRVHILAKELSVPSKTIIEKCRAEGIDSVKNHMSTLSAGLHATIREWFSEGSHDTVVETSTRVDLAKVRIKRKPRPKKSGEEADGSADQNNTPSVTAVAEAPDFAPSTVAATPPASATSTAVPAVADQKNTFLEPDVVQATEVAAPPTSSPPAPPVVTAESPVVGTVPDAVTAPLESTAQPGVLGSVDDVAADVSAAPQPPESVVPAGPQNVPVPAKLRGPRVVRYETPDRLQPIRRGPRTRTPPGQAGVSGDVTMQPPETVPGKAAPGRGAQRRKGRGSGAGEHQSGWRDRDLAERQQRLAGATGRRIHHRRAAQSGRSGRAPSESGPKTSATVHEPVRMKEFCSETGINFIQLFRVLKEEHNLVANVNMILPVETAELLALHFGIELKVIPTKTKLDDLQEEFANRPRKNDVPRPPVVAMLGHVDHGKTSLLDAVRRTRVASGEDGGITQHIGSYHLETSHGAVTFLDTPGHEAFTAMRARGANMTDVVVLVVAADDGVMPQTIEAINHAKAAETSVVVALNKIDLGDQNKLKIYGQLAEHGLTPSGEWGGDVDVIPTSATTGLGVQELVDHLADLSSVLDLKADPTLPAMGTVIEAETKPGVGSVVRVLVQDGTLRVGNFVVCGNASGKVRALLNDRGERITQAGPSIPVEIWGLDDVPRAGDKLYQVANMQRAKEVATELQQYRIASSRAQASKVHSLEEMFRQRDAGDIPELNVVIKADVDGSVVALRHALSNIETDEVKLAIRHAGIGPVNDSDVLLASTCRGIAIAFRVDVPVGARRLAEQNSVDVRSYRVIYDVCDDIKKALEGLLAPEERVEARAVIEVRQVFNITKVGTVAGSLVTSGVVDRNHFAKIVRNGTVVRDGCRFASVRRFKDDVKEVRSGMECGVRLEGFNDIHVGDLIETYEIIKIARTL